MEFQMLRQPSQASAPLFCAWHRGRNSTVDPGLALELSKRFPVARMFFFQRSQDDDIAPYLVVHPTYNPSFCGGLTLLYPTYNWGYNPLTNWDEPPSIPVFMTKDNTI